LVYFRENYDETGSSKNLNARSRRNSITESRRNSYTETRRNSNRESRRNSLEQIKLEFEMKSYKPTLGSAICRRKEKSRKKKYTKRSLKTKWELHGFTIPNIV